MTNQILGIHHVTSMCGDPQANVDFYAKTLGMKMVKVTINYDDPSSYHFYYGDGLGRPGTLLTFFPWPSAPRGVTGVSQADTTSFAVPKGSLDFWKLRLSAAGIEADESIEFGFPTLTLLDPDEMIIQLVESIDTPATDANYGEIPASFAIHGFHHVRLLSARPESTEKLLTETMDYSLKGEENDVKLYETNFTDSTFGRYIQIPQSPQVPFGRMGTGITHHVAFRVADDPSHEVVREQIMNAGQRPTEIIDRTYFHSIYFREPGGVLFEIATDNPGNTVNESAEELGTSLQLPPWLEPQRDAVAAGLPEFVGPTGIHFPRGKK
ncbi:MAG: ring-cleaving dioxygenase [Fimbriimonadaceae bacterium]|nr:ring-cleaving dioxygenase [Fimbriimonadaceae bacterium]